MPSSIDITMSVRMDIDTARYSHNNESKTKIGTAI